MTDICQRFNRRTAHQRAIFDRQSAYQAPMSASTKASQAHEWNARPARQEIMNGLRIIWESFGNHLHHHDTKPTYIHRTVQVQSQLFDSSTKSHTEPMSSITFDRHNGHTCKSCLNAYFCTHDYRVHCYNREFDAQFDQTINTTVRLDEWCTRWSQRRANQRPLTTPHAIQLELFAFK